LRGPHRDGGVLLLEWRLPARPLERKTHHSKLWSAFLNFWICERSIVIVHWRLNYCIRKNPEDIIHNDIRP
jgi:hypothetical protein